MGVVQKTGFSVEKIVFESQPKFYVTGCLFIPDNLKSRAPAILNVIGHTGIAFRSPSYQRPIMNLVSKGFIVFAMDPIGQGERLQYFDPGLGRSVVGGPTSLLPDLIDLSQPPKVELQGRLTSNDGRPAARLLSIQFN